METIERRAPAALARLLRLFLLGGIGLMLASVQPIAARAEAGGFEEVAPGVFVRRGADEEATPANHGAIGNAGFVVGADRVAVIDTGGSLTDGQAILRAVRAVTDRPVEIVVNTHFHPDHVFGNAAFAGLPGIRIVGHPNLARGLSARADYYEERARAAMGGDAESARVVLPTEAASDGTAIDLGGRILEIALFPSAHTDSDLTVLDRATGTLFAGDLLFVDRVPSIDGSIRGWLDAIGKLEAMPARRIVPGHGPTSIPAEDAFAAEKRYLEAIVTGVREAIADGQSIDQAVQSVAQDERANWLLFDDYNPRNVTAAFTELEWE
ncbi:quinoprotein relay system zinc metallohydrolase 2 [Marinivivus vitaminiproducens]|uniref:quinoprotein relay system zinc metallohydrolase 2 n=1 Tax=Marinivivus vitaminiproducens TaxID=3035935 RepID=UPI0027A46F61|nr:quinoprotein relay system zinc metallohydrolase 2 [Geminicoccaceae bacterium SCSIO 64248]